MSKHILPNLPPKGLFCKVHVVVTTLVHSRAPSGMPPLKAEKSASIISQDLVFLVPDCPCPFNGSYELILIITICQVNVIS